MSEESSAQRKSQYAARLSRARNYNQERRSGKGSLLSGPQSGDAGLWSSLEVSNGANSIRSPRSDLSPTATPRSQPPPPAPLTHHPTVIDAPPPTRASSRSSAAPAAPVLSAAPASELYGATDAAVGALWSWSVKRRMLAIVDSTQTLRLIGDHLTLSPFIRTPRPHMRTPFPRLFTACISLSLTPKRDVDCIADAEGAVLYRVKLPGDGTTIFVGWESTGAVLAVVQKLGGACLWFPAKPGTVQQWEGMQVESRTPFPYAFPYTTPHSPHPSMQCTHTHARTHLLLLPFVFVRPFFVSTLFSGHFFLFWTRFLVCQFSSKMMKSSVLKRNAHFDTCFACWSESGKLVLGLADGNFAVWDLSSNETFMSRKHFAGKHHNAIMAGAWAPLGEHLALASAYQLKVSQPLLNASWEQTAAKLDLNGGDGTIQQLHFSRTGCVLAAIAGASIFRCVFLHSHRFVPICHTRFFPIHSICLCCSPSVDTSGCMLW